MQKFLAGLRKTRERLAGHLEALFTLGRRIDDDYLEELEETLILADVGVETTGQLIREVQEAYKAGTIASADGVRGYLMTRLGESIRAEDPGIHHAPAGPTVILVAGVNGVGKTTSIAKLAAWFKRQGKRVVLAAGDTFRAAAVEQLGVWGERLGVDVVRHQTGGDPAAVAFDACEAAVARGADVLLVDTAGRLHTAGNLMKELAKVRNVLGRRIPGAPHEVLLVLDATTGQNAIAQAREFKQVIDVTGIFLAKLDGTAKGGIVVAIKRQVDVPVKFVGMGETPDDLAEFDSTRFVEALFS
ncbi:MAG: signal recognition particle-docking protein FtsY [Planctomycetes bacterium]|nr:signal recognition particle-docking protein FtsY [Planctomycetota bacterium]